MDKGKGAGKGGLKAKSAPAKKKAAAAPVADPAATKPAAAKKKGK